MASADIVATSDGYILGHYACDQDSYVVPNPGLPMRTSYYYNSAEDYAIRRGYAYFDTSEIPSGASISDISLTMYTLDKPEAFARDNVSTWIMGLNNWPYAGAYELWDAIPNETTAYATPSWYAVGSHTVALDGSGAAISDYNSHPTWFAVGLTLDESAETGELDFCSTNDSFAYTKPTLTIAYSTGKRRSWVVIY